jgi:hypothetical protein
MLLEAGQHSEVALIQDRTAGRWTLPAQVDDALNIAEQIELGSSTANIPPVVALAPNIGCSKSRHALVVRVDTGRRPNEMSIWPRSRTRWQPLSTWSVTISESSS